MLGLHINDHKDLLCLDTVRFDVETIETKTIENRLYLCLACFVWTQGYILCKYVLIAKAVFISSQKEFKWYIHCFYDFRNQEHMISSIVESSNHNILT